MSFTTEDLKYLDSKFGGVYERLDRQGTEQTTTKADLRNHLDPEQPCPKAESVIRSHLSDKHDFAKFVALVVGLASLAGILVQVLFFFWPKH